MDVELEAVLSSNVELFIADVLMNACEFCIVVWVILIVLFDYRLRQHEELRLAMEVASNSKLSTVLVCESYHINVMSKRACVGARPFSLFSYT